MRRVLITGLAAALHVAAPARAADPTWDDCVQTADIDRKIAACTTVLARRNETRERRWSAFAFRANGHIAKGNHDQALADAGEAIRLNPAFAHAYNNRGAAYIGKGEYSAAVADLSEAIRLDPQGPLAYSNRGLAYVRLGEYARAIADLSEAIRLNPQLANPYRHRAAAHQGKGDLEQALKDYDQALKLNPGYADALSGRAEVHAAKGDPERALFDYEVAARIAAAAGNAAAERRAREGGRSVREAIEARRKDGSTPQAPANEKRVALVIGNADYKAHRFLKNPGRDAEAIAAALREAGFTVTLVFDLGRAQFIDALNAFADQAANAHWAVIYFAGHGLEMDRTNYVLPVDARIHQDRDVQDEGVALDRILQAVEPARRMRLVVLDACRNNPFVTSMQTAGGRTRAIGRGLARVEPAAGVLVAFAAKEGQEALDGEDGANSPFAAALAHRMKEPGLELGMLFRRVRDDVLGATGNKQEPYVYGSLPGETLFLRQVANESGSEALPMRAR